MSFAKLQELIDKTGNPAVAGLDPALGNIPPYILDRHISEKGETLEAAAGAVLEFNKGLIDALCGIVPAVKPQSAYYEQLGEAGVAALAETCRYAKSKGMYVILDAKRGDIAATAQAYSAAYLGAVRVGNTEHMPFDADALTVNAYLGSDGLMPFLDDAVKYDKAIFALVKTSNPSAGELQDRLLQENVFPRSGGSPQNAGNVPLYVAAGELIEKISAGTINKQGYTRLGAVVGATYPEEMKELRKRLKHTFFLVPGYGMQGGSADDAAYAFDKNGQGAIVNSSRAIIAAWKTRGLQDTGGKNGKSGDGYADDARREALKMRDDLRRALS